MEFTPNLQIKTNTDLIFEVDQVFPDWLIRSGEQQFKQFAFEYGHHGQGIDDGNPYFGKMLYLMEENWQQECPTIVYNLIDYIKLEILHKIDPDSKFECLQRIAVNGQMPGQSPNAHIDHVTLNNLWTLVYYANESDGDTIFYRSNMHPDKEVFRSKFKKGKCVIFPGYFRHRADSPSDKWRVTVGISFVWHTNMNKLLKQDRKNDS